MQISKAACNNTAFAKSNVAYHNAWRVKQSLLLKTQGTPDQQFGTMIDRFEKLIVKFPGTRFWISLIYVEPTDGNPVPMNKHQFIFDAYFMAPITGITAANQSLSKKVESMDFAHLTSRYRGVMSDIVMPGPQGEVIMKVLGVHAVRSDARVRVCHT